MTNINCESASIIYKSRNVLLEMLDAQGYDTSEYANYSVNEINTMYNMDQLDMFMQKKTIDEYTKRFKKVYIRYDLVSKAISKQNVNNLAEDTDLFNNEYLTNDDNLIVVTNNDNNDTILNLLTSIYSNKGIFIIIHNINRLQFNILKHQLVPNHRIMVKKEVDEMKKRYNITDIKQLPEISRFDPVAQCICMRPGDICEITRPSNTSVTSNYYRLCVQ
jgi:DNA-directed RNA polymerase subunit H (RpoH/RPB5)